MATIPADGDRAHRVADGLRRHRRVVSLGCRRGCPLGRHEPPDCLVGCKIEDIVDYNDSAIWVPYGGSVRLTDLREVARWSQ
jgi:hypothetical protein